MEVVNIGEESAESFQVRQQLDMKSILFHNPEELYHVMSGNPPVMKIVTLGEILEAVKN